MPRIYPDSFYSNIAKYIQKELIRTANDVFFTNLDNVSEDDAYGILPRNLADIINSNRDDPTQDLVKNARVNRNLTSEDCMYIDDEFQLIMETHVNDPPTWQTFLNNIALSYNIKLECQSMRLPVDCDRISETMMSTLKTPIRRYPSYAFCLDED